MFGDKCKIHGVELKQKFYGGKSAEYCPECRKELFGEAILNHVEKLRQTNIKEKIFKAHNPAITK